MSEKKHYLYLQHRESVVASMSATIFSSLIQSNPLNDDNEDELIEKSVALAIKIAELSDKLVESDEEWVKERK